MEKETQIRRLVVHDLPVDAVCADANTDVAADDGNLQPCIGCYGCWIKTPGQCVLHDGWEHMGWRIAQCEELVLISRCVYGSVSPFVKNVLDRSIPYLHPDFARVEGQMHHKQRYAERRALRVLFLRRCDGGRAANRPPLGCGHGIEYGHDGQTGGLPACRA